MSSNNPNNYFLQVARLLILGCFLVFVYHKSFKESYFNYDSIPYVASAYMLSGKSLEESHDYAWNLLKEKSHPSVFKDLCCGSSYRKSMYENTEAFGSHLPSYRTKSLYILLIRSSSNLFSIDEFQALKIISFASVILIGLMAYQLFSRESLLIYLCVFPLLFLMQIIPLGRLLTPDSLLGFLMLLAGISMLNGRKKFGYFILLLSVLVRQTNIIVYALFLLFEVKRKNYRAFIIFLVLGLTVYWLNSVSFESIGFWKTYYSSLISMPDTFIGFNPSFDTSILFSTLLGKLNWMLGNSELNRLISLMVLMLLLSLINLKSVQKGDLDDALVPVFFSAGAMIAYVLIPFPDFRIYAGYLLASTFTLLLGIAKRNKAR